MKNYYLILIENFIGIGYLILFLLGFFTDNLNFIHIGGIGMLIFMFIMIKGQPKNLSSFLFMCVIGSVAGYFISKWWLGLFWVSAFFSAGQLFGIIALLKNRKQIIDQVEEQKNDTEDLFKFAMTGKTANPDKISIIEILFFIGLLIGPYLFANNLMVNTVDIKSNSLENEFKEQVLYMEKSKEYSNQGIQIMNLSGSQVVSQNKIDSYKEFLKKSIEEAKKVDTTVLNKIKNGFGTIYYEKYLRAKELELQGYEMGNASSLTKGQILYDEFVDWMDENTNGVK
jgi:hypothetical protein